MSAKTIRLTEEQWAAVECLRVARGLRSANEVILALVTEATVKLPRKETT